MNYYIVGTNENGLGETILAGKTEKLIATENELANRDKWLHPTIPNFDGIKLIAEQETINAAAKLAEVTSLIQSIKQQADRYITNQFGAIVAAGIGMTTAEMNKPLALAVKTDFITPISAHVTEVCTAIAAGQSYNFDLSQFTTPTTEEQIRAEAGL